MTTRLMIVIILVILVIIAPRMNESCEKHFDENKFICILLGFQQKHSIIVYINVSEHLWYLKGVTG